MFTSCAKARVSVLQDLQIPEVKRLAAEATLAGSEAETQRLWQQVDAHFTAFPVALLVHAFVDGICWSARARKTAVAALTSTCPGGAFLSGSGRR